MKNRFSLTLFSLALLLSVSTQLLAQDSVKKPIAVKPKTLPLKIPQTQKPAATPYAKPVTQYAKPGVATPTQGQPGAPVVKPAYAPADPADLTGKPLTAQYDYVNSKIYHYQQPLISAFWKNIVDTLNAERKMLKTSQGKLDELNKNVNGMKATVAANQQTLAASNEKADALSVAGIIVSKSMFVITMLCIAGGLALALIIVIFTTGKHKHEARYRTGLYEELEEEYKTFKAKANEKEKKLARELQTERNKLDELLGRG